MGIIKAAIHAVGGALADQWLEVLEPDEMDDSTVFTRGVTVRRNDKRGQNRKGTADTVSNGSIVHVYPNQFMLLVDGGKVVDFTAYRQAAHPEEYAPREEAPGRPRPVRRRRTLALTVDLAATGAVVVLLAAVVLRFFAG